MTGLTPDLMLLKSTLSDLGLPVKTLFSSKQFYAYLIDNPSLVTRLFQGISIDGLLSIEAYEAPLIKGIEKIAKINDEERYIFQTLITQLETMNVAYVELDIQLSLIQSDLLHNASMNSDIDVNMSHFVVELLFNIKMVNQVEALNIIPG